MLSRNYKLKKETDFKKIFQKGKYKRGELFRVKFLRNHLEFSRFALVIGLKISKKSTQRNKVKRQIEEILRLNLENIKKGFDLVIWVEPDILEKDYQVLEKHLISLLQQAQLWI